MQVQAAIPSHQLANKESSPLTFAILVHFTPYHPETDSLNHALTDPAFARPSLPQPEPSSQLSTPAPSIRPSSLQQRNSTQRRPNTHQQQASQRYVPLIIPATPRARCLPVPSKWPVRRDAANPTSPPFHSSLARPPHKEGSGSAAHILPLFTQAPCHTLTLILVQTAASVNRELAKNNSTTACG